MKALVFYGVGDIRVVDVAEPEIQDPTDAIVRLTASAICGTDLHLIRGTMGGDRREESWLEVELEPSVEATEQSTGQSVPVR